MKTALSCKKSCSTKSDDARTQSLSSDDSENPRKRKRTEPVIIDLDDYSSTEPDIEDTDYAESSSSSVDITTDDESEDYDYDDESEDDDTVFRIEEVRRTSEIGGDRESGQGSLAASAARRHSSGHGWVRNGSTSSSGTYLNITDDEEESEEETARIEEVHRESRDKKIDARNKNRVSSRTRSRGGTLYRATRVNYDDSDLEDCSDDVALEVPNVEKSKLNVENKDKCHRASEERNRNKEECNKKIDASTKVDKASEPVPQEKEEKKGVPNVHHPRPISPAKSIPDQVGHKDSDAVVSDSSHSHRANEGTECTKQHSDEGRYDICRLLLECVLGRGKADGVEAIAEMLNPEHKTQSQNHQSIATTALPLKFRFEDEVPKEVEKKDHEKEMAGLFVELDRDWALSVLKAFDYPDAEVDEKSHSNITETQYDRCRRGVHKLILRDEEGLVCRYCTHVEIGPKDVMPEWAAKAYRSGSERKGQHATEYHLPGIEGANLPQSFANIETADFDCSTREGSTVWSIKPGVRETMYEHQQEGFEFLWKNLAGSINLHELKSVSDPDDDHVGGCIISHAPGTGKTRLTIVFIETYLKMFPNCRPVIVAPASMLLTWEEEFRKWNVEFPFININSTDTSTLEKDITAKLLAAGLRGVVNKRHNTEYVRLVKLCAWDTTGRSVLGISYSLFEKMTWHKSKESSDDYDRIESFRRIFFEKPGLVVLDEGHTPRNQRSNIWNVLLKLRTRKRVILSGTPFQNNFCELFNTLRIVRPNVADALAQEKTFCGMIALRGRRTGDFDDRAVERLKAAMVPFVHVHKGTILQKNLPGLKDCVILLKPPALQKSLIESLEACSNTFEFEHRVALISVHPHLCQHSDQTKLEHKVACSVEASRLNPNEGCKTRFVVELIHLSTAVDEKVLIFSQYIQPLQLIKEQLKEIFKWCEGRQILQMRGRLDQKQRQMLINVFNDPKSDSKVMLASTRCCSEGISLVGASRVVLLDVLWNPSVERQAICRAYRIGQKKVVYTYHLMTLGTTEADKYCRQAEKERLSELVFTSSSKEGNREKHCSSSSLAASACIEDSFLEHMVGHPTLNGMFEKIINQPKDTNLIETFGLTS